MEALLKEVEGLSEEDMTKVIEFVHFLKYSSKNEKREDTNKPKRVLGSLKGGLKYMAEDFDETPDCFKEYM